MLSPFYGDHRLGIRSALFNRDELAGHPFVEQSLKRIRFTVTGFDFRANKLEATPHDVAQACVSSVPDKLACKCALLVCD